MVKIASLCHSPESHFDSNKGKQKKMEGLNIEMLLSSLFVDVFFFYEMDVFFVDVSRDTCCFANTSSTKLPSAHNF